MALRKDAYGASDKPALSTLRTRADGDSSKRTSYASRNNGIFISERCDGVWAIAHYDYYSTIERLKSAHVACVVERGVRSHHDTLHTIW